MSDKREHLLHLFIINRSGSLIYNRQLDTTSSLTPYLDPNDALMFAGTFHALHTISAHAVPPPKFPHEVSDFGTTSGLSAPIGTNPNTLVGQGQGQGISQQYQPIPKNNNSNNNNNNNNNAVANTQPQSINTSNNNLTQLQAHQLHQLQQHNIITNPSTFNNGVSLTTILQPHKLPIQQTFGISQIETKNFKMNCLQTPTGLKIIMISTPNYPEVGNCLRGVNVLYVDYVLKNPFHEMGMPIRSELFEKNLSKLLVTSVTLKH